MKSEQERAPRERTERPFYCVGAILRSVQSIVVCISRGEPVDGPEFYKSISGNDEFCAELGRAVLAAGRLETALKKYIDKNAKNTGPTRATLGQLITVARQQNLLSNMLPSLEILLNQRNYLTHNVHALLSGLIEQTILEGSNLIDSDVHTYTERAWQLAENLNGLAEILEREST